MSVGTNVVKITAKTALNGNMIKSIIAGAIPIFLYFICQYSTAFLSTVIGEIASWCISALMTIFLIFPVLLGVLKFFWRILFSADDGPVYVFYWFSSKEKYLKCLKFILRFLSRIVLWLLIFNVPAFLLRFVSSDTFFEFLSMPMPLWMANLSFYTKLVQFVAIMFSFFLTLKYYMAPVLFIADDEIDSDEAMHMSAVISKKSYIDFISLIFSFLGWILLSLLIFPLLFTLPYILVSYLVHVRFAVAEYNLHIKQSVKPIFWQV